MIPYGHQHISEDDIQEVVNVLRSDWLTQGPAVERFESAVAEYCGAQYAVAVSSGTAALHLAALAAGFSPGDEVITSPITFVASANCIVYAGAIPSFADIDSDTYCIDIERLQEKISVRTKGVIPVHFSGQPCDMEKLSAVALENRLTVIEDAAHALGASYEVNGEWHKVGSCAHSDMTIFSFHPVKHITTGEGGMITTNNKNFYERLLLLRSHGITKDRQKMTRNEGSWYYEQHELGFNYRITDLQCALGLSQTKKIDHFLCRRREIAERYNQAFARISSLKLPFQRQGTHSSWHLYVLQCRDMKRRKLFDRLQDSGTGVHVHYIPVHTQPYYQKYFGFRQGDYPQAETYYQHAITLPIHPSLSDKEIDFVISSVLNATR
jgi:perosamine synthetase